MARYEDLHVNKLRVGNNNETTAKAYGVNWTVSAEATNDVTITGQVVDARGNDLAARCALAFYLADDANGDTPASVAHSGGIAIGTDGALIESVANLSGTVITEADGDFDLVATEAGSKTAYMVCVLPDGSLSVSDAITHAA